MLLGVKHNKRHISIIGWVDHGVDPGGILVYRVEYGKPWQSDLHWYSWLQYYSMGWYTMWKRTFVTGGRPRAVYWKHKKDL